MENAAKKIVRYNYIDDGTSVTNYWHGNRITTSWNRWMKKVENVDEHGDTRRWYHGDNGITVYASRDIEEYYWWEKHHRNNVRRRNWKGGSGGTTNDIVLVSSHHNSCASTRRGTISLSLSATHRPTIAAKFRCHRNYLYLFFCVHRFSLSIGIIRILVVVRFFFLERLFRALGYARNVTGL